MTIEDSAEDAQGAASHEEEGLAAADRKILAKLEELEKAKKRADELCDYLTQQGMGLAFQRGLSVVFSPDGNSVGGANITIYQTGSRRDSRELIELAAQIPGTRKFHEEYLGVLIALRKLHKELKKAEEDY